MVNTQFVNYLAYSKGSIVSYQGYWFIFIADHAPGSWDLRQVVQINPSLLNTSSSTNFNTLPDYNISRTLPLSKYKVIYHQNNDNIETIGNFIEDTQVYTPGESVTIKNYAGDYYTASGLYLYRFLGWSNIKGTGVVSSFEELSTSYFYVAVASVHTMLDHDVNLYAQWRKIPTITVTELGVVSLNLNEDLTQHRPDKLVIPEYFEGRRTKLIDSNIFNGSSIDEIILPASISTLYEDAFNGWLGHTIHFIDADVTTKYPALELMSGCFGNTPNLTSIILPYRWHRIDGISFPECTNKNIIIYIRNTSAFMADLFNAPDATLDELESMFANISNPSINYSRTIHWGWNN